MLYLITKLPIYYRIFLEFNIFVCSGRIALISIQKVNKAILVTKFDHISATSRSQIYLLLFLIINFQRYSNNIYIQGACKELF